jgi:hypothetical protein
MWLILLIISTNFVIYNVYSIKDLVRYYFK